MPELKVTERRPPLGLHLKAEIPCGESHDAEHSLLPQPEGIENDTNIRIIQ